MSENKVYFDLLHGFTAACKSKTTAWALIRNACNSAKKEVPIMDKVFEKGWTYEAHHVPSGEDWLILGIDVIGNRVCAAGYPPSIGKLRDCVSITPLRQLTEDELSYREKNFGSSWL